MRILLDENLPVELAGGLTGHEVSTVSGLGWQGIKNGELLRRAQERFDVLVTMDRKLEFQQDLGRFELSVVVLLAPSNRLAHLRPLVPGILKTLESLRHGELRKVSSPGTKADRPN